jgi:hypothetical protein
MVGTITPEEARLLVLQTQLYYVTGSERKKQLLETFHEDPGRFEFQVWLRACVCVHGFFELHFQDVHDLLAALCAYRHLLTSLSGLINKASVIDSLITSCYLLIFSQRRPPLIIIASRSPWKP